MRHPWEMQPPASVWPCRKFCTHLKEHEHSPIWVSHNQRRVPWGLLYIGALVPCGVLLQIPHSPIITTINYDTQPPAPGVGWEVVERGSSRCYEHLWQLSYTCSLLWGWRSHGGRWLRAQKAGVQRYEDIIGKLVQLSFFRRVKNHLLFHILRSITSKYKRIPRKQVLVMMNEQYILLNVPSSAETLTYAQNMH